MKRKYKVRVPASEAHDVVLEYEVEASSRKEAKEMARAREERPNDREDCGATLVEVLWGDAEVDPV